jgi:UDP-N-acetylglucosamine acyltransferase
MAKIYPNAIIDKKAELASDVEVGPFCVIGPNVKIGKGTILGSHVVIEGYTTIGSGCELYRGATIGLPAQDKKSKNLRSFVEIGDENIIREFVTVHSGSQENSKTIIGSRNMLMAYCHVAHDCQVGNDITMANNATLGGYVTVEDKAVLGGLAAFHQFVRVGQMAMVGGIAKVVQDVLPFSICDGNPARFVGLNSVGLKRNGLGAGQRTELKKAYSILLSSGLSLEDAKRELASQFPANEHVKHVLTFIKHSKRGFLRRREEEKEEDADVMV